MLGTLLSKWQYLSLLSFLFYWFSVWIYHLIHFCWWFFCRGKSGEVVGHATQHVRSGFSYQRSNPCLWQWKHRVLTTGPSVNQGSPWFGTWICCLLCPWSLYLSFLSTGKFSFCLYSKATNKYFESKSEHWPTSEIQRYEIYRVFF